MARDRDIFPNYKAPTPTIDASDAAEKARTRAMSKANAASRPATFLEQVENQIAKTKTSISNLENTAAELGAINPDAMKKFKGESNTEFNKRVTAAYKAQEQPTLTDEQVAQGFTVQFVRTGAGGKGEPIRAGCERGAPTVTTHACLSMCCFTMRPAHLLRLPRAGGLLLSTTRFAESGCLRAYIHIL